MVYGKTIEENPTEYFTEDVLNQINEYVKQTFNYGTNSAKTFDSESMTEEDVGEASDFIDDVE